MSCGNCWEVNSVAEKTNVPEIRFAGFTDPWEQRKLGELGFAQSGIGFPNTEQGGTEGTPFFKVSDMNMSGNEHELVTSNNYVTPEQIARMGWHPINQVPAIFFAKVGAAVMLNRKRLVNKPFLMDNNTMAFSMDSSLLNTQFGQSLFERLDLTCLIQVGALPSYNSSDVESITVSLPSTMDEQRQIGECLCNINDLITLHQRKYDKLCAVKKSMLDKMFPKPGETEPEIRFAGFTDPWEQRKLGDVTKIKTGDSDLQDAVPNGLYPFFVRSDKVERSNRYLFDGEAILVPGEGRLGEIFHYINGKFDYHQRVYKISDFVDVDAKFVMYSMMYGFKKHALENTAKATVDSIRLPTLTEFKFRVPCRDEQYQINVFFSRLDNLITLHQRKLNLLKNTKKSLLDRMFV